MDESGAFKILIVNDEPTVRHLLARWITRSMTAEVLEAEDGLQALESIAVRGVDLVIADVKMPVLNGIEMLSIIRADPANADLEVIVASGVGTEDTVRQAIGLGVSDYLLKPLQQDRVITRVEKARQRVMEARQKKSSGLDRSRTRILIADPDPNFCDFADAALSVQFDVQTTRTVGDVLVRVLRWKPDLILLSPELPRPPLEFMLGKVRNLGEKNELRVFLLVDSESQVPDSEDVAGWLPHTYVPESFLSNVVQLLAGEAAPQHGILSWVGSLEPEIVTALRQSLGMMTGEEPTDAEPPEGDPEFDLFGTMGLHADSDGLRLAVHMDCKRSSARALVTTMLECEEGDIDEESESSGIQEMLNVIAGRIKNSCATRKIDVLLGLPEINDQPSEAPSNVLYKKEKHFAWSKDHLFRLTFYASAGFQAPISET